MKTVLSIAVACAALPGLTFAIDNTSHAANKTSVKSHDDEIIVTATKTPKPVSEVLSVAHVVNANDIERLQPRDLPSLLGRISGVSFRDSGGRGSASGVFVRGAVPSQTVVLINGIRVASATLGAATLEAIPVSSIERIEVVKGPLSGIYGADAIGGVIQIFTHQPDDVTETGGTLKVTAGSHNTQKYNVSVHSGDGKNQFRANLNYEETDGIDRTTITSGGNNDDDDFEETSGSLSAILRPADEVAIYLDYLRTDYTNDFDNTFGADTGYVTDGEVESFSSKLVYDINDAVKLTTDLGYFRDESVTPAFLSDIETERKSLSVQLDTVVSSSSTLTAGVDYYDEEVDTRASFSETKRDNTGIFAQWQYQQGDLSMTASVRHDDNEAYGEDTNSSFALGYDIAENLLVTLSYGTAFKAPSFNDLYFPFYGNPDIKPEESESVELSIRGNHADVQWRVSLYKTDVDDLIAYNILTFSADNIDEATLEGVELEASTYIGQWYVAANAEYLEARDDITNEFLDDRALVSANLEVGRFYNAFYMGVDVQGEHGRHDGNGRVLGGFGKVDINLSYQFTEQFKVSGRIGNLFDKKYVLNVVSFNDDYRTDDRTFEISGSYDF